MKKFIGALPVALLLCACGGYHRPMTVGMGGTGTGSGTTTTGGMGTPMPGPYSVPQHRSGMPSGTSRTRK